MIKLKFLLIFVIVCSSQVASQSAECKYAHTGDYSTYTCKLTLLDAVESTQVAGQHLEGKSDDDVKFIHAWGSPSKTKKMPRRLCDKFKNVEKIELIGVGLKEIDENSFKNCNNLEILRLSNNQIEKLPQKTFANLPKLKNVRLHENRISDIDDTSFANLPSLEVLTMSENIISNFPDGIFASLINLKYLVLDRNYIKSFSYLWFGDAVKKLEILQFNSNYVESIDERIIDNIPTLMEIRGNFGKCIKNVYEPIKDTDAARPNIKRVYKRCFKSFNAPESTAMESDSDED